jgi:hypothetical protein
VQRLPRVPLASRRGHIRTTLFVGVCGFFTVTFKRASARQMVARLAGVFRFPS